MLVFDISMRPLFCGQVAVLARAHCGCLPVGIYHARILEKCLNPRKVGYLIYRSAKSKSITLQNDFPRSLRILLPALCSTRDFHHCSSILAQRPTPANTPVPCGKCEFQCWVQSSKFFRRSCRNLRRLRWDYCNIYSDIRGGVPLPTGDGEAIAEIFSAHCVCFMPACYLY